MDGKKHIEDIYIYIIYIHTHVYTQFMGILPGHPAGEAPNGGSA
jgi:hypothetical protein